MTTMIDGRRISRTDRVALARKWAAQWPVGTPGRLSWGPIVKVVEHQVSRGWSVVVVELLQRYRDMPSGTRLYLFYGARRDLKRLN